MNVKKHRDIKPTGLRHRRTQQPDNGISSSQNTTNLTAPSSSIWCIPRVQFRILQKNTCQVTAYVEAWRRGQQQVGFVRTQLIMS